MRFKDHFRLLSEREQKSVEELLERHNNPITIEQIADGITITLVNARQLYEDAAALRQLGRHARSQALLIAAMEELGKVAVLASMSRIPKNNQKLWADAWQSFRNHEHKSTCAFTQTYADEARAFPSLIATAAMQQLSLASICERLRQYGLYVDFHAGEKCWLSPSEINADDVGIWNDRVEVVLSRTEAFYDAGLYSVKALEIQREVYSEFNADRPRRKDCTLDDLSSALDETPKLAQTYFRRLMEEGLISYDTDLPIGSTPVLDLLGRDPKE